MINNNGFELKNFDSSYFLGFSNLVSVFNPTLVSLDDMERSYIVAEEMKKYNKSYSDKRIDTDLNTLLSSAIYDLESLGCVTSVSDTVSLVNGLDYYHSEDSSPYLFATLSQAEMTCSGFAKKAKTIILPSSFSTSSRCFIGHELTHILKERNPRECNNVYTVQEMVPILVELMIAYMSLEDDDFARLIDDRLHLIAEEARGFLKYRDAIKNCYSKYKEALKIAMSISSGYLNSFYYAVSIFQYFLDNPSYIASLVAAVTRMEITTNDMINILLNKYNNDEMNNEYREGIKLIKSVL